jgi:5-methylthioadenosine/S-adenosylhomocysteine deaminase
MTVIIRDAFLIGGKALEGVSAAIAIEDGRIAAIGASEDVAARFASAEIIDAAGKALAPGLANCHTHFARIHGRGVMDDLNAPNRPPFSRAGLMRMPGLAPAERDVMVRLAVLEAIRSGTTLAMEVGPNLEAYADILGQSGLRVVLAEQVSDRPSGVLVGEADKLTFDPAAIEPNLARIENLHAGRHGGFDGRMSVAVAAHAPDMVSPDLFRDLHKLRDKLGIGATVHLNQYWGEVEAVERTFGIKPTEHLDRMGWLDSRVVAVHCRCITPAEEEILGKRNVSVCFTPGVSARNGIACRAGIVEDAGATIVLGTDEFTEDMTEAMRFGLLLERLRRVDSQSPQPDDIWRWATRNGYAALGVTDGGSIEVGARADLIMIDFTKAHLAPNVRPAANFVHHGCAGDVSDVMVDGHWLMRDGKVLTLDEDAIVRDAQAIGRAAWAKAVAAAPRGTRIPAGFDL